MLVCLDRCRGGAASIILEELWQEKEALECPIKGLGFRVWGLGLSQTKSALFSQGPQKIAGSAQAYCLYWVPISDTQLLEKMATEQNEDPHPCGYIRFCITRPTWRLHLVGAIKLPVRLTNPLLSSARTRTRAPHFGFFKIDLNNRFQWSP